MNKDQPVKLTPALLRKIIREEAAKNFGEMKPADSSHAKEVDADELGDDSTLEKKIDYMKALKIEERRLARRLKVVRESLSRAAAAIAGPTNRN